MEVLTRRKTNEVRASEKVWAGKRSLEVTGMETVVKAPAYEHLEFKEVWKN